MHQEPAFFPEKRFCKVCLMTVSLIPKEMLIQMIQICDDWSDHMDKGKLTGVVFLDICKVFDSVDHSILLEKVKFYGVADRELMWFKVLSYCLTTTMFNKWLLIFSKELTLWSSPRLYSWPSPFPYLHK